VQAGALEEVDHDVLFRVTEGRDGQRTYVPRVVLADTKGSLGSLSRLGGPPRPRPPRAAARPPQPPACGATGTLYDDSPPPPQQHGGYQALAAGEMASAGVWGGGVQAIVQVRPARARARACPLL